MDLIARERLDDTFEMAQAELAEVKDSKGLLLAQEVERRAEMVQRVVKRMLQGTWHSALGFWRACPRQNSRPV